MKYCIIYTKLTQNLNWVLYWLHVACRATSSRLMDFTGTVLIHFGLLVFLLTLISMRLIPSFNKAYEILHLQVAEVWLWVSSDQILHDLIKSIFFTFQIGELNCSQTLLVESENIKGCFLKELLWLLLGTDSFFVNWLYHVKSQRCLPTGLYSQ